MRLFVIAGETSGDLHGAKVVSDFIKYAPNASVQAWGGDKIEAAGAHLKMHIRELNVMGFSDVILKLPKLISLLNSCKKDISEFNPDLILFIDFAGFNLRIAKWAKSKNYTNHWYIAPKTWAWNESRVHRIRKHVDQLYCIFPFEEAYFRGHNVPVEYVGNPLMDQVDSNLKHTPRPNTIALLPGSRKQELDRTLPILGKLIRNTNRYTWQIAATDQYTDQEYYDALRIQDSSQVAIIRGNTTALLSKCSLAIVTSGTATLEAAIIGIPQLVIYKTSWLNYQIGKALIKTRYISLPNLIANKPVVDEYIQGRFNETDIENWILNHTDVEQSKMKEEYKSIRNQLKASKSVGRLIHSSMSRNI